MVEELRDCLLGILAVCCFWAVFLGVGRLLFGPPIRMPQKRMRTTVKERPGETIAPKAKPARMPIGSACGFLVCVVVLLVALGYTGSSEPVYVEDGF